MNDVRTMRREFDGGGLRRGDLTDDPGALFERWFAAAQAAGSPDPNAMALATVDPDGHPACRMVLMRAFDARGLAFYTNFGSRKGRAIERSGRAAATFWWPSLERQVRVEGTVERVAEAEADAYFASRPRGSQVAAWASPQSEEVEDRAALDAAIEAVERRFAGAIPRPEFWGGLRLCPDAWEFWQGRPGRAHDRFRYARQADGAWRITRLWP